MTEEEKIEIVRRAQEDAATSEVLTRLQLTRKYYLDALRFIESNTRLVRDCMPTTFGKEQE